MIDLDGDNDEGGSTDLMQSEKEWQEREQAVVKGKEMKQKKREANLAKRREDKGSKGKKSNTKKKAKNRRPPWLRCTASTTPYVALSPESTL